MLVGLVRSAALARKLGPFDAIHVHDLPLVKTALGAGKRMGARVVADLHENYPMVLPFYSSSESLSRVGRFLLDPRRWEAYERRCVPSCDATIAVTDRDEESARIDRCRS